MENKWYSMYYSQRSYKTPNDYISPGDRIDLIKSEYCKE